MVEPVSSDLLAPPTEAGSIPSPRWQAAVGAAVVLVAAGMALGALQIPGDAGYGGVGPNFLPWLCAAVLALCGGGVIIAATIWQTLRSVSTRPVEAT